MAIEMKNLSVKNVEIPVIYERNTQLPLFYVQLIFRGAGAVSNRKTLGLSDITSSLLNEGTKDLGVTQFSKKLEEKALTLNAESGLETLSLTLSGMSTMREYGISLIKELLNNPNFTQKALEKVKENSLVAILERESDYDYQASRALKSMLFKGTALEFPLSGTQDSIARMTLKEVENFYHQYINLNSLILIIGGDMEFSNITKELENMLEVLPQGKVTTIQPILPNDSMQTKYLSKETQQAYIYFGAPLEVKNLQKESALIKVASFVLGGSGFGSRMLEEVRVNRGLAYSAVMQLNATRTQAIAQGYLQTSLKNEKEAKNLVKEVVKEFVQNGITNQELQEAKNYLLGSEPLRNETLSQRLGTAFNYYYNGLPLDFNKQVLDEVSKLTLEEVNQYIKTHKEIQKLSFAIVSAED